MLGLCALALGAFLARYRAELAVLRSAGATRARLAPDAGPPEPIVLQPASPVPTALLVGRRGCTITLPATASPGRPVYLVLASEDRSARIYLWGRGTRRVVNLPPHDIAVEELSWPAWWPERRRREILRLGTAAGPGAERVCQARLALDIEAAARLCLAYGRPDRAWTLLTRNHAATPSLTMFLAAAETGRSGEAARAAAAADLPPATAAEAAATERSIALDAPPPISVVPPPARGELLREWNAEGAVTFPVLLPAGRYTLRGRLRTSALSGTFEVRDHTGARLLPGDWSSCTGDVPFQLTLPVRYTTRLSLHIVSATTAEIALSALELRWSPETARASLRSRVIDARARAELAQQQPDRARAWLASDPDTGWDEAARRALWFQVEWASPVIDYEGLRAAARSVLERAPAHFAARELLRVTAQVPLYATRYREAGSRTPVPIPPFASLVNAAVTNGHLRCVLEVDRNAMPPVALALARRHHGHWQVVVARPLGLHRAYHEGERIVADLPLPRSYPLDRLAVGLVAREGGADDVLPAADGVDGYVPLAPWVAPVLPPDTPGS